MRGATGGTFAAATTGLFLLSACASSGLKPVSAPVGRLTPQPAPAVTPLRPSAPPPAASLVSLSRLSGWPDEDYSAALQAFQTGCGVAKAPAWRAVCLRAKQQTNLGEPAARAFFEDNFKADLRPATGLLTAYFAPEYPAREEPDEIYSAPVRPKPDDLVMQDPEPGDPSGKKIARQMIETDYLAYPDRAEIEAQPVDRALAFMKPEDLFFLQIQGSGTLVFPDGRRQKAIYAADNGRPFVGIARPMTEAGLMATNHSSGDAIRSWLADHRGAQANEVMDKNPRYVFFNLIQDDAHDPAGAAGVSLPAGRSLAVDPSYHAYGELYWIDAAAPVLTGAARAYRRLAVALDTGSAIRGDVRADLYMGRGDQAGLEAGHVRHSLLLIRLVPVQGDGRAAGVKDEKTLRADEIRLWAAVASTVRPGPGRTLPAVPEPEPPLPAPSAVAGRPAAPPPPPAPSKRSSVNAAPPALSTIEPLRRRRIARERDPIGAHLDLHGMDQDRARVALKSFLRQAFLEGLRSVLVITGKGALGDGVLRRRVPEWLAEPEVRPLIAGVSQADRRHGGGGALYIALKRRQF